MTFKEKLTEIIHLKAEIKTLDDKMRKLQTEVLKDWEGDYDLDGIRVYQKQGARYTIDKIKLDDFEKKYPQCVDKTYKTTRKEGKETLSIPETDKHKFFKKKLTSPYLVFEGC